VVTLLRPESTIIAAWSLREDRRAAAQARQLVRDALAGMGIAVDLLDDMVLMTSELVANAVLYGDPPLELVIRSMPHELCIEVIDTSLVSPRMRSADHEAEHGRGLGIVADLSRGQCGFRRAAYTTKKNLYGKAVWFSVPVILPSSTPRTQGGRRDD
jgi:hypothetical protein